MVLFLYPCVTQPVRVAMPMRARPLTSLLSSPRMAAVMRQAV
jgi:hypothetical protein